MIQCMLIELEQIVANYCFDQRTVCELTMEGTSILLNWRTLIPILYLFQFVDKRIYSLTKDTRDCQVVMPQVPSP